MSKSLYIYHSLEILSEAAAELFSRQAKEAVKSKRYFAVALSGGHTPKRSYELLASEPFKNRIPWEYVYIFWGDERCVPHTDPRSNQRMAHQALLDYVPIPRSQIFPIPCNAKPKEAAQKYEKILRDFFSRKKIRGLDLVLLGMGKNGHTASLFPDTSVLREREHWVKEAYDSENKLYRVTLTAPFINQAKLVVFLVAGESKAQALHEVLEGPYDPQHIPAQLIHPNHGRLLWFVDKEATELITNPGIKFDFSP